MVGKLDGTIVIHVPKDLELAFLRIAELKGLKSQNTAVRLLNEKLNPLGVSLSA